jgi:hypothetical protein
MVYALLERENLMSINFDTMAAALTKIQGAEASTVALVADLNAKLAELAARISDPADQAKVEEFAAAFSAEADKLPQAIVANPAPVVEPPVEEPPVEGGSVGGITNGV